MSIVFNEIWYPACEYFVNNISGVDRPPIQVPGLMNKNEGNFTKQVNGANALWTNV